MPADSACFIVLDEGSELTETHARSPRQSYVTVMGGAICGMLDGFD